MCTWLLVCLGRQGVAASASDNFGSGKLLAAIGGHSNPEGHEHAHEHALHEARISHVRTTLNNRLHAVLAGSRTRQFEKWASKQGDLQVISMHGVDESKLDFDKDGDNGDGRVASSDGLFPDDAINLSIIGGVGVPELNQGNHVELPGEHGVSMLDLFLRSIRLSFHFTPVVSTSWLAFLSSTFRTKVWFKWVATCLASSGPAFIKWGEHIYVNCHRRFFSFSCANVHRQDNGPQPALTCFRSRCVLLCLNCTTMPQAIHGSTRRRSWKRVLACQRALF